MIEVRRAAVPVWHEGLRDDASLGRSAGFQPFVHRAPGNPVREESGMNVKWKLASWTASGRRAERRRIVNMAARLNERDTTALDVRAVDVSSVGCMVTPAGPSTGGDVVWLKLSGLEPLRCRVIWVDADEAGCWFERKLHKSEVERLVEESRNRPSAPVTSFGRRLMATAG
jgi:hypothetical protein